MIALSNSEIMSQKIRVGLLFGGKSAEHEISLRSAQNIVKALDTTIFEPVLIGIDKQGVWHLNNQAHFLLEAESASTIQLESGEHQVTLLPHSAGGNLMSSTNQSLGAIDVVFPILHGPLGEDGTIQGLLRLADVPFVGSDVLGSAVGMDKDVMKRLLRDAGIPIAPFITLKAHQSKTLSFDDATKKLGLPLFIKPANMGSSVGVSKVRNAKEYDAALVEAFKYDTKLLIESAIEGDEIECGILGNDDPKASIPGKIIPHSDFYSYEAKYIDPDGACLEIPANLSPEITAKVQEIAIAAFQALEAFGMARVDMFVTKSGEVLVNEINTIPGFTPSSMYPKLWEISGISYTDLITQLLKLAIERSNSQRTLSSSR